ncbi:hypothetical protein [Stenotrophomonas maltophilia]|uniref:hypothetical protein n=1 Tax=Stenotrophomonas maltophilia TaxID=40324 RepID=UPI003BF91FCA
MNTTEDFACAVELPYWQAPNDDLAVQFEGDSLTATFKIWESPSRYSKLKGLFEFSGVWAARHQRHKGLKYYRDREDDTFASCYWLIPNSSWLKTLKAERSASFPGWEDYEAGEYTHYIIQSNAFYIEVIARNIKISRIDP